VVLDSTVTPDKTILHSTLSVLPTSTVLMPHSISMGMASTQSSMMIPVTAAVITPTSSISNNWYVHMYNYMYVAISKLIHIYPI